MPDVMVVIEVQSVDCSPPDGPADEDTVAAAMTGWATAEFELTPAG